MKKLILTLGLVAATMTVTARHLTPAEALNAYLSTSQSASMRAPQERPTLNCEIGDEVYVYNYSGNGGYLILSAESEAPQLLGYGMQGNYNEADAPEALKWWLGEYARQISQQQPGAKRISHLQAQAIEPLCKTKWSQGSPYNIQCPKFGTSTAPTGCMATAMAQVMKYHNYPPIGSGSASYSYSYDGESYDNSADFSQSHYQWDKMLNSYNSGQYTQEEANAVGLLMADLGVAIKMKYGKSASGGFTQPLPYGMVEYFGYDKGITIGRRQAYTNEAWEQAIYNNIKEQMPVFYMGYGQGGGHAFVADGFDGKGYFHFNWGWSGLSDGYFLLTALDPPALGTGGGTGGGFNDNQVVFLNVCPDKGTQAVTPSLFFGGAFETSATSYTRSITTKIKITNSGVATQNNCAATLKKLMPGVKLVSKSDASNVQYVTAITSFTELQPAQQFTTYEMRSNNFPVGDWIMSPAFRVANVWYDVTMGLNTVRELPVKVTATDITIGKGDNNTYLTLTDVKIPEEIYAKKKFLVTATVKNNGPQYYGNLNVIASNGSGSVEGPQLTVVLGKEETAQLEWVGKISATAGEYELSIVADDGTVLTQPQKVTVKKAPTGTAVVTVTSVEVDSLRGSGNASNPYIIDLSKAHFTVHVQCTGGYYSDMVAGKVYRFGTSTNVPALTELSRQWIALNKDETATLTFEGDLSMLENDVRYSLKLPFEGSTIVFKSAVSGISTLNQDQVPAVYYNMQGVELPERPTTPGLYIERRAKSKIIVIK